MKRICGLVTTALLAACGGEPEDCSDIQPSGTYKIHYEELEGDCDLDIPDSLISLDSLELEPGVGCDIISANESDDECRSDFDIVCTSSTDNVRLRQTGFFEIKDDQGDKIEGDITFLARRLDNGSFICSSTYRVALTKQ